MRELLDVDAARGDIGGDQDRVAFIYKLDEHFVAILLVTVTVREEGMISFLAYSSAGSWRCCLRLQITTADSRLKYTNCKACTLVRSTF